MLLYVEYLTRKGLQKFIPKEEETSDIIVTHSYLSDWQIWIYFISTYMALITAFDSMLGMRAKKWVSYFNKEQKTIGLSEQKTLLFTNMTQLEEVWEKWSKLTLRSRSSLVEIDNWCEI